MCVVSLPLGYSSSPLQLAVFAHPRVRLANKAWHLTVDSLEETATHLTYEACMTGHRSDADQWTAEDAATFVPRLAAAQAAAGKPALDWDVVQSRVHAMLKNTLIAATTQYEMHKQVGREGGGV